MIDLRLRIFLADKRLSFKEFSKLTGIREATIAAYANDTYKMISKDHINIMCKTLCCSPGELIKYIPDKE